MYVGKPSGSVTTRDLRRISQARERCGSGAGTYGYGLRTLSQFRFREMAEFADVALAFSLLHNSSLNGQPIEVEANRH